MYRLEETLAQIYNVNTGRSGNDQLKERIEKQLEVSQIICVNAESKLVKVVPTNILDTVREYNIVLAPF